MDQRLRPPPHPKAPPAAKPAPAVGPAPGGFGALGGAFGAPANPFSALAPGGAAAGVASAQAPNLMPNLRDTKWFTSDYFVAANPSERQRRPHRGAHTHAIADVSRNLKSRPFLEVSCRSRARCPFLLLVSPAPFHHL